MVILDENDFPIDTIYTNENGKFNFNKLNYDNQFSALFLDIAETDWDEIEMYFEDKNGNKLGDAVFENGKFVFAEKNYLPKPKPKPTETIATTNNAIENKSVEKMVKDGWNGLTTEQKDIYFDFAVAKLSRDGKLKLDILATFLNENKSQKVTLLGHTDNVGTENSNLEVGMKRANSAKDYLISKGVGSNRLSIDSKGENAPIASNETDAGREKNRRVEVVLK
jgi:outer membrane protein OmpA-like peptidoglycan-associated protein